MIKIKNQPVEMAEKYVIDNMAEGYTYSCKRPYVQLAFGEKGLDVKFTVFEKDPRRVMTKNFQFVNRDSCVELFLNFNPSVSDRYVNFEVNANGKMNASFRRDRYEETPLTEEDVEGLCIKPEIFGDYWTVSYTVSFGFIKKYYPAFDLSKKETMKGNIYKCGDDTEEEHYLMYYPVNVKPIDFHRPEFFGDFVIE